MAEVSDLAATLNLNSHAPGASSSDSSSGSSAEREPLKLTNLPKDPCV